MITTPNAVIVAVNAAFTTTTGYRSDEAVGQTPRLLWSGHHNANFYAEMWRCILAEGSWEGEIWDRRKNGEIYPKWLRITAVKSASGETTHYIGTQGDISARKIAEDQIRHLAFYDHLTDLPNRRLLVDRLGHALASSARSNQSGALLFIDLDDFKTLNDTLGHDVGDLLLQQVGLRLMACVRDGDTVARLGGDEFVVLLEGLGGRLEEAAVQAENLATKILASLNQIYQLGSHQCHSTPSIGVAMFCGQQHSIEELLKRADLAMYQSKAAGRNSLSFFDPDMQAVLAERTALVRELGDAVIQEQFVLYYQAQVMSGGRVIGAEALVRWQHPQRGLLPPNEFIALAEETGLILSLGHWILKTACAQLALWARRPSLSHFAVAVNVSARQLHHPEFVDQVLSVLEQTGANPRRIKLELTESLLVSNIEDAIDKMVALKKMGIGFSLDDFGTGYSSLSYLKRLPLDQLKIDQSFVRDIVNNANDAAIAKIVILLAESLSLTVIAEGVETPEQRDFLAGLGCDACQGYLFSYPVTVDKFEELLVRIPPCRQSHDAV
jgi:diguanylate cyclase (GGDEF)-like protein/PAS domain S-box-containing protein